jgi:hypothetical protein
MPLLVMPVVLGLTFAIPDGWQDVSAQARDHKLGLVDLDDKTTLGVAGAQLDAGGELEALMWTAITQQEVPFNDIYLRTFAEQAIDRMKRAGDASARVLDRSWVKLGVVDAGRLTIELTVDGRSMRQLAYFMRPGEGSIAIINYMCPAQLIARYQPVFEASVLSIAGGGRPAVAPAVAPAVSDEKLPSPSPTPASEPAGKVTPTATRTDALEWLLYVAIAALLGASVVAWRLTRNARPRQ